MTNQKNNICFCFNTFLPPAEFFRGFRSLLYKNLHRFLFLHFETKKKMFRKQNLTAQESPKTLSHQADNSNYYTQNSKAFFCASPPPSANIAKRERECETCGSNEGERERGAPRTLRSSGGESMVLLLPLVPQHTPFCSLL